MNNTPIVGKPVGDGDGATVGLLVGVADGILLGTPVGSSNICEYKK